MEDMAATYDDAGERDMASFKCPVQGCAYGGERPQLGFRSPEHVRAHLNAVHNQDLPALAKQGENVAEVNKCRLPADSLVRCERKDREVVAAAYAQSAAWFCAQPECCDIVRTNGGGGGGGQAYCPRDYFLNDSKWFTHNKHKHKGTRNTKVCAACVCLLACRSTWDSSVCVTQL